MGYRRVRAFDGGMAEWSEAGLPVDRGPEIALDPPRARSNAQRRVSVAAPSSSPWTIKRLLILWLGINLVCGFLYWGLSFLPGQGLRELGTPLGHGSADLLEAIYFSFVTGLSIGFGDVVPNGVLRVL